MTRVLLVTGARSLADDPAAEAWARGLIAEALRGVDLLIVGDAPGPDAWAWELATGVVDIRHRYWTRREHAGSIEARDAQGNLMAWWTWGSRRTGPLDRNAAMVTDAAVYRDEGDTVSVLALLDGRKPAVVKPGEERPTRGTEHTARLARDAGLTVDAQTWPPKGATT